MQFIHEINHSIIVPIDNEKVSNNVFFILLKYNEYVKKYAHFVHIKHHRLIINKTESQNEERIFNLVSYKMRKNYVSSLSRICFDVIDLHGSDESSINTLRQLENEAA